MSKQETPQVGLIKGSGKNSQLFNVRLDAFRKNIRNYMHDIKVDEYFMKANQKQLGVTRKQLEQMISFLVENNEIFLFEKHGNVCLKVNV